MQNRLKQLRMSFGLDRPSFAGLLECAAAEVEIWEKAGALPEEAVARVVKRFGIAPEWLTGGSDAVWGGKLLDVRRWVASHVNHLTGPNLVRALTATTGERIAYAIGLMRKAEPKMCTLEWAACWLGLSPGSTERLMRGELDPGSPVIARASDLTGIPVQWFREGPGALIDKEKGDLE
ncbi:MAG TPA: hypothetical protein VD902_07450 [Symbiobacteriaceae bacterium]|nr:hypothetical protein [Symbiobacteriaceae bacterium]